MSNVIPMGPPPGSTEREEGGSLEVGALPSGDVMLLVTDSVGERVYLTFQRSDALSLVRQMAVLQRHLAVVDASCEELVKEIDAIGGQQKIACAIDYCQCDGLK